MQAGLSDRVDRRLAAILVADVAGYSRLMEADEAGTARVLREHRAAADPLVAEHGGRVVKTTGDGVLIEFSSVVGAVQCAVALQKLMAERNAGVPSDRRGDWRVGIHLGDILVAGDDIIGDGVNIAARLESIAEPGGICISEDAFRQVRGKIETEFNDGGEQTLKNIARPVRVHHWQLSTGIAPILRPPLMATMRVSRWALATLAILFAFGTVSLWWGSKLPAIDPKTASRGASDPDAAQLAPVRPSIAVLPFVNQSGDAAQDYFSDGITEDLIAALGRFPELAVVARNASFSYKGNAVGPKDIGRELGVRYIVEGSVRRAGSRVRVSAQLSDTATGKLLWSQQYDEELKDVFALQDSVTRQVAGT